MSFFWWIFGSLFIFLGFYYLFVAIDRYNVKKKQRLGGIVRGATPVVTTNQQQTVIYTIPTTRQLAHQYPQVVRTSYPPHAAGGQNNPPPYVLDLPPTYDQVIYRN